MSVLCPEAIKSGGSSDLKYMTAVAAEHETTIKDNTKSAKMCFCPLPGVLSTAQTQSLKPIPASIIETIKI